MITKAYMGGKEVVFYREKDLFLPAKKDTNRYYIKLHTHIDKDENLIIKVRNISKRLKYRIARGERFNLVAAVRCTNRSMNFRLSKKKRYGSQWPAYYTPNKPFRGGYGICRATRRAYGSGRGLWAHKFILGELNINKLLYIIPLNDDRWIEKSKLISRVRNLQRHPSSWEGTPLYIDYRIILVEQNSRRQVRTKSKIQRYWPASIRNPLTH